MKIPKGRHFWKEKKKYFKWGRVSCKSPCATKKLDEIALSRTVKETAIMLVKKIFLLN